MKSGAKGRKGGNKTASTALSSFGAVLHRNNALSRVAEALPSGELHLVTWSAGDAVVGTNGRS